MQTRKFNRSNARMRDLDGYKATHLKTAEEKGISSKLMSAPTITEAKKIMFGSKQKPSTCCKDGKCCQCKK